MQIQLFAGLTRLGEVKSRIIDDSMGVVGGWLKPSIAYHENFRSFFRSHSEKAGWQRLTKLGIKAALETGEILHCSGGICVTDVEGFDEIGVEFCGLSQHVMDMFRNQ